MYQPFLPLDHRAPERPPESRGVIYTRRWVVDLILDLAGYREVTNLVDALAIEPAAGEGAFLIPMACRLVASCRRQRRPYQDCASALVAYEIDRGSAEKARTSLITALVDDGVEPDAAESLAEGWIKVGDYLMEPPRPDRADFIVGNPPYVRLEDLPEETAQFYRAAYPTVRGRADLYVAFYEASLRQLKDGGVCVFICADRWMLNCHEPCESRS